MVATFWTQNPNVLFQDLRFFPTEDMDMPERLNAISRTIIVLTVLGYLYGQNTLVVVIGLILLFSIYFYYKYTVAAVEAETEAFLSAAAAAAAMPKYTQPTAQNPLANVLVTDIAERPDRGPAAPDYTPAGMAAVNESVKDMVCEINYSQKDLRDKLFADLGDNFQFEQSMRPFYGTAATEIPNDQQAFAEFCYGGMISCKEGNKFACVRNLPRYGEGS